MLCPVYSRPQVRRGWYAILLGVLVGVSLLLRSSFIGIIEFKADEATALALTAKQLTGALAQTGLVSSVGIFNPPFFIYLLAIPGIFTLDPQVITMSVIAANKTIGQFWMTAFNMEPRCPHKL